MKDIMYFGCLLTGDCKHTVSGLTDEYGNPVRVVLEKDGDDVMLAVFYEEDDDDDSDDDDDDDDEEDDEMTRAEFDKICEEYSKKDCEDCPMFRTCDENVERGTGFHFDDDYECPGEDCYECPYCGDCSRTAGW